MNEKHQWPQTTPEIVDNRVNLDGWLRCGTAPPYHLRSFHFCAPLPRRPSPTTLLPFSFLTTPFFCSSHYCCPNIQLVHLNGSLSHPISYSISNQLLLPIFTLHQNRPSLLLSGPIYNHFKHSEDNKKTTQTQHQ